MHEPTGKTKLCRPPCLTLQDLRLKQELKAKRTQLPSGAHPCHSRPLGLQMLINRIWLVHYAAQVGHARCFRARLLLLGGDGGVARDEGRHDAPGRLNAQRQRRHVQQQQVLHLSTCLAPQDCRLRSSPNFSDIHGMALDEPSRPAPSLVMTSN